MKKLLSLISILLLSFNVFADDAVVIIVNSANQQALTLSDVKNIYSDNVVTWSNGDKIKVYNLKETSSARETFSKKVLGVSAQEAAAAESNRKITNTIRNPSYTKRERLLVSVVSKRPNAIGYATKKSIEGRTGIRIVLTLE